MKITVVGSHLCPDTLYALNKLSAAGAEVSFQDILSCHAALRLTCISAKPATCTRRSAAHSVWVSPASFRRTAP